MTGTITRIMERSRNGLRIQHLREGENMPNIEIYTPSQCFRCHAPIYLRSYEFEDGYSRACSLTIIIGTLDIYALNV